MNGYKLLSAHLTNRQKEVLSKLAWGWSYSRIQEFLHISPANMHTIAHAIRKASGIKDTKNAEECRYWQRGHRLINAVTYAPGPTKRQLEVMRLRAQGLGYPEIALRLGITAQCAQDQCSKGCKRARIGGTKHHRVYGLRNWLAERDEKQGIVKTSDPAQDDF